MSSVRIHFPRGERVKRNRIGLRDSTERFVFGMPEQWLNGILSLYQGNGRQAYGFMNGVLNTDNTSIFGLSMDFGPFAVNPLYSANIVYGCEMSNKKY
jgi:hypothetical protein